MNESKYYYNENTPSWKRLTNYHNLTDEELPNLLNEVYTEFKANHYDEYLKNKLISSILLFFNEEDLFEIDSEKLFNECKEVFETYFRKNKDYAKKIVFNYHDRFFYDGGYDGLGFISSKAFDHLLISIKEMKTNQKTDILKNDSLELLQAIEEKNIDNLLSLLEGSKDKDIISYRNEAILEHIEAKKLFNALKETNGIIMHFFGGIIKDRYVNGFDELLKEESFLQELLGLSEEYILSNKGKLSAFNIKSKIKQNLIIAIDKIENIKEEKRGISTT